MFQSVTNAVQRFRFLLLWKSLSDLYYSLLLKGVKKNEACLKTIHIWLTWRANYPGIFSSTLSYHCFCVPNWICKKLKTFSHAKSRKKSAGGLQNTISLPARQGQNPGVESVGKPLEARHIWALRISYFSLKLLHNFTNDIA